MHCPYCHSEHVHPSRSKNARLGLLRLLAVYLRCYTCARTFLRWRFLPAFLG